MGMIKITVLTDGCHIPDDWDVLYSKEFRSTLSGRALRIWVHIPDSLRPSVTEEEE